jgi:hypothetical protein
VAPGFFSLDRQLKVVGTRKSEGVSKLSVWLSGLVPFERAAEILERVGRMHTSRGSVWQQANLYGRKFQTEEQKVRDAAQQVDLWQAIVPGEVQQDKRMGT